MMFEKFGGRMEAAEIPQIEKQTEKNDRVDAPSMEDLRGLLKEAFPCKMTEEHGAAKEDYTFYQDDHGSLYRIGDRLLPQASYEINGYKYNTDGLGRIVSAEGTLHLKDENRDRLRIKDTIETIGKGDQKDGDDRGHLIGDQFDGSNGLENLVPQDANINRIDFKNFENELAREVRSGNDVYMKVEPIYDGDSNRPSNILVTYSINGKEDIKIFPND